MAPISERTTVELHECRQCCSFCDRTVHPSGCIASGCQYLYLYDDEQSGRRFIGYTEAFDCVNPGFFRKPTPEDADAAFDIRDL